MTEQHLQQSELFYRNLIADSLDGILLTDEEGTISFASPSVTKLLDYQPNELTGRSVFEFVYVDDLELATTTFKDEARMQAQVKFINIRLIKKNGTQVWCIVRGHNLLGNPYVGRMAIYFYDDTLRKMAEEALVQSERRFRTQATILNNVTDVIVTTDTERVVSSWNKVTEKLTGITASEAIGHPFRGVLDTDYSPYTHEQVAAIVLTQGIWRGEISFQGSGGEKKYLLHTVSLLYNEEGENIGMLGVGKDITERKMIEARLQESETFYRNLISHSLDGIVLTDREGKVTYCAPSVSKLAGYEPQHLLGRSIFEFVHPDDAGIAGQAFYTEIRKESAIDYLALRLRHSDNDWVWCTVRGHNLLDNPVFNGVVIYFTNDTKRKEIEDRLKESEQQFRSLIYNLSQGIVLQNEKGEVIVCNKAALQILGVTEDQLLGANAFESRWNAINEDGSNIPGHEHPGMIAASTKKQVRDMVMGICRPATGEKIWLLVNADPMLDSRDNIINIIISFSDITEQKRLSRELIEQEIHKQKQLTQATIDGQEKERQEIGKELHDNINQHLTTTRLYLEVAKEKASGEVLEMIRLAHQNLAAIIKEIRQLSQSLVPSTLGDLGLVESVYDLCDSLKRAQTFQVEFQHKYFNEDSLPGNLKLMLFRIIQEQVNNIVRHANANMIQIRLQLDAEYIILGIIDDGKGFDLHNFRKGLGFSNITSRAGLFNGKVEIDAARGMGCTLTVIIPMPDLADTSD
ncbi:MAG: PAS domain S-box protein [Chitinophagaceae bacterium]